MKLKIDQIIENEEQIGFKMGLKDSKQSLKELVKKVQVQSFAEEIENDKTKIATYLERFKDAEKNYGKDHKISKQEKLSTDVFKRVLILAGTNEINIIGSEKTGIATENNLPVCSYLAHGGRIKIEIPKNSDDKMINWLTSGDENLDGKSRKQNQLKALTEGKIVYNRSAATHDINRKKVNGEYQLVEKKGFVIGAKDFVLNKFFSVKTKHYGVDLALNAKFNDKDSLGNEVLKPDGDHGHLYIHYKPATSLKPGSILIGLEGAAPSSQKHSKTGASNPLTPIDGSKFRDLAKKLTSDKRYQTTIIPKKIDGLSIKLTSESINKVTALKSDEYGQELAYIMPSKSVEDFQKKRDVIVNAKPKRNVGENIAKKVAIFDKKSKNQGMRI